MHAVQQLHQYRKSLSTTTYKSRGQRVIRCELCRLAKPFCICALAPKVSSQAGFLMLMYDTEVLKPSNTGKLIADLIPDSFAFLWSRTQVNPDIISLLNDPMWQPMVVFPKAYAGEEREIFDNEITVTSGKRPLFIMLDGSWREAKKMFRRSPYLQNLPVVSFTPKTPEDSTELSSRYQIRLAANNTELATAEVAAQVLSLAGEQTNADLLDLWFDVFSYQYQRGVCQINKANPNAVADYTAFAKLNGITLAKDITN
ncbi:tRNA-uridine aminocarboxypropyltransferase [Colwellia sp. Arc7-D]|jgi:DTW domain-containing protein YfiP|uniref:tRNA-uridine aminocarboxypropyltransferase n=1 Tax=Colwellia sp. Arc7-D TaxID=2161872 RepID=UPI000D39C122|nr:tRNA-uridine aminocarboxypropyltransferase [Colwellia sp. Arc7-D]AWB58352.1 DTW domain-containing protein [Colwellia sp. Arc7-D]|tara:strand:- start:564 stop:1334 length:771 start_codon:yes stop_codon:yes gene_type:complete